MHENFTLFFNSDEISDGGATDNFSSKIENAKQHFVANKRLYSQLLNVKLVEKVASDRMKPSCYISTLMNANSFQHAQLAFIYRRWFRLAEIMTNHYRNQSIHKSADGQITKLHITSLIGLDIAGAIEPESYKYQNMMFMLSRMVGCSKVDSFLFR